MSEKPVDVHMEKTLQLALEKVRNDFAFVFSVTEFAKEAFANSEAHGFTEKMEDIGLKIALMHGELSEALEAARKNITVSEHISAFTGIEEEFADTIIRILSFSYANKLRVAEAILAKHAFNVGRPYMHGGKNF